MEDGEIVEGTAMDEDSKSRLPPKLGKSHYEVLQESKSSVENIVSTILSLKRSGNLGSGLREHVTQMFLLFVVLRQVNRAILVEEDRAKAETDNAKAPVDSTTLLLHNLMYEKNHYVKAIKACKDFKTKYPDIELVPQEEYFRDAPEDIKGASPDSDSPHQLMLKRLSYELHQRRELCQLQEQLEQRKKKLMEVITNRKKFLYSLPSHLKSLKKASIPIQNHLGIPHAIKSKQRNLAELLPPPLYVIYTQFMAQKDAFSEDIHVEIVGNVKEAQCIASHRANHNFGSSTNGDFSKTEDDALDEDDDGQRRKRPKRSSSALLDQSKIYSVHPLMILLHVYDNEISGPKRSKIISLRFEYLFKVNLVCVATDGHSDAYEDNILCNLFPNDTGAELPHQSAKLINGSFILDTKRAAKPYKWAQHLGGIDFLPELAPSLSSHEHMEPQSTKSILSGLELYRRQNRVHIILQRIRSRRKAQLALLEQISMLEEHKWPSLVYQNVPWASHKPSCNIEEWSSANTSDSKELIVDKKVQEPDVARENETLSALQEAAEDGELPSAAPAAQDATSNKHNLDSGIKLPKSMSLLSKRVVSPNKEKLHSFRKQSEDMDLLLDADLDEDILVDVDVEKSNSVLQCNNIAKKSWEEYGMKIFYLHLSRASRCTDSSLCNIELESKIKISSEYPLRPPLFALSFNKTGENEGKNIDSKWCNQLHSMEAQVNFHMLKILPVHEENFILSHQVHCLAMMYDYLIDEALSCTNKTNAVVDIGLCEPTSGDLAVRSLRGRDRRMLLSWKDMGCNVGFPS